MTRDVIAQAKKNSEEKAWQELYHKIVYMLENAKWEDSEEMVTQVWFNLSGLAILSDILRRMQSANTRNQELQAQVLVLIKQLQHARVALEKAGIEYEYKEKGSE